jgi:predicted RNA-binding Zn-ribbon protein involved in translation (DUF1610 family)
MLPNVLKKLLDDHMNSEKIISCPSCGKKVRVPTGKHIRFACPDCNEDLEYSDIKAIKTKYVEDDADESNIGDTIISILSHLVTIPVFIILHKRLPDPEWDFNFDRVLLFIATLFVVEIFFHTARVLTLILFFIFFVSLSYGTIWGHYGFGGLYKDYKHMVYALFYSPYPQEVIISAVNPFPRKREIKEAIDFENPEVRNFAVSATRKHFLEEQNENPDYRTIIQCFALFKEINNNWNYVSDPVNSEYYAKAGESLKHLSGDCDDYSIVMSACIKAIGGTPRLVHTEGHLYPELLIGSRMDMEFVNYLVRRILFSDEAREQRLYYHVDEQGQVWLNLDYTAKYPGGKFMDEEILGILTLE